MTSSMLVVVSVNNNNTMYVPNVVVNDIHLLQVCHGYSFTNFQHITILTIILYSSLLFFSTTIFISVSEYQ